MKGFIVLSAAVMLLIVMTGCGAKQREAVGEDEPPLLMDEVEVVIPVVPIIEPEPDPVLPFRYPLTGIGSEQETERRPVMVMVENQALARPQTGLIDADIIYEILAEGDITRFAAVFQSKSPEIVGPVRSIRPYYVQIGDGFDALIVHAGWSQEAMNMLVDRKLAHFDEVYGEGAYFWRDTVRKAPHNVYTSIDKIREGAAHRKYREEWRAVSPLFLTEEEAKDPIVAESAGKVTIHYIGKYNVIYEYDAEKRIYNRMMAGEPHKDKDTEVQLTATNILICESDHRILDNVGRRSVDMTGPGKGLLVQAGKVRDISWERQDGMIRPYIDGQQVGLLPGQTWIQVVPKGSKVEVES